MFIHREMIECCQYNGLIQIMMEDSILVKHTHGYTWQKARPFWISFIGTLVILAVAITSILHLPVSVHAASGDWPTFLGSNARTGYNASETIITSTTASKLKLHWTDTAKGIASSEPVVANGLVYWGSWDGLEHATNPATGKDTWAAGLGARPGPCTPTYGVVGAAAVATVPINGVATSAVFAAGGLDDVVALNANTGRVLWQATVGTSSSQNIFGSPTVYNGSVYVGIASNIDCPVVQGKVVQVNASTGAVQNVFNVVPNGCIGGGVWGTIAVDEATGMLYFGTGNGGKCSQREPLTQAIIELRASNLSLVASWAVPASDAVSDGDYGSTPTLFQATINGVSHPMVGMTNKDGYYYALDRTNVNAGALWKQRISLGGSSPETGNGSISASAFDGTNLYIGGGRTTINGQSCPGSVSSINPNTGSFQWRICLSDVVLDPVIAVPGVVVVGSGKTMSVLNASNGQTLFRYTDTTSNAKFWGAGTISNGILYEVSRSKKLFAFGF